MISGALNVCGVVTVFPKKYLELFTGSHLHVVQYF